ncbi:MAG: 7,8-didemethyl-8-hydroxy-5-deazariboflavin synthase subunit CofG [Cyanophyceae cyanobacterium]
MLTYSPAVTLVPTYECFNRCSYCNFRVEPGGDRWLPLEVAAERLKSLQGQGIAEILILSGEVHPASPRRGEWFTHLYNLCELSLSMGFLPHTNAGPLTRSEMAALGAVNGSMGLMLEQVTPMLLETVHRHAPSKVPTVRLEQLEMAGDLKIPFTTGLLIGLGETGADRAETLGAIAASQGRHGHIQEVIVQPYLPGTRQAGAAPGCDRAELLETVALAREILPPEVVVQVPPNLLGDRGTLLAAIGLGARDLGGIGPTDEVNPDYGHVSPAQLETWLAADGWTLKPRLAVYPQYDGWVSEAVQPVLAAWRSRLMASDYPHGADPRDRSRSGDRFSD